MQFSNTSQLLLQSANRIANNSNPDIKSGSGVGGGPPATLFTATEHFFLALLESASVSNQNQNHNVDDDDFVLSINPEETKFIQILFPPSSQTFNLVKSKTQEFISATNAAFHKNKQNNNQNAAKSAPLNSRFTPSLIRAFNVARHLVKTFSSSSSSGEVSGCCSSSSSSPTTPEVTPSILLLSLLAISVLGEKPTAVHHILRNAHCDPDQIFVNLVKIEEASLPGLCALPVFKDNNFSTSSSSKEELRKKLLPPNEITQELGFSEVIRVNVAANPSPQSNMFSKELAGRAPPTSTSHWVYPGKICCGRSPGCSPTKDFITLLSSRAGVNTFINLQTSFTEYGCTDYAQFLKDNSSKIQVANPLVLLPHHHQGKSGSSSSPSSNVVEFYHAPTADFGITSDSTLLARMEELHRLFQECLNGNRVIYIHCFSGHGRTGTALVNLMAMIDGTSHYEAMEKLQKLHLVREDCKARGFSCALGRGHLEDPEQQKQTDEMKVMMKRGYNKAL